MGDQMSGKIFAPDDIDIRVGQILTTLRKQQMNNPLKFY